MSKNLSVLINRKYKYDLAKISKVASIVKGKIKKITLENDLFKPFPEKKIFQVKLDAINKGMSW